MQNTLDEIGAAYETLREPAECRRPRRSSCPASATSADRGARRRVARNDAGARRGGTPFLGICLGLQALFEGSEEAPDVRGLGVLRRQVQRLAGDAAAPEDPHIGWNELEFRKPARLLAGLDSGAQVYFTHSYAAPRDGRVRRRDLHANDLRRRRSKKATCSACSSTPRNRATPACRS